jgi:hypothetical protein
MLREKRKCNQILTEKKGRSVKETKINTTVLVILHHCDKIPEENILKKKRFIVAYHFRAVCLSMVACCFLSLLLWACGKEKHHSGGSGWQRSPLTSWQPGSG